MCLMGTIVNWQCADQETLCHIDYGVNVFT